MIKYLEKENFEDVIKDRVLVDFYATWCGPCKMLGEVFESVHKDIDIPIVKVDVDKFEKLAREYKVMSIPTLILFENGREVKKHIGFMDEKKLKDFIY